MGSADIVKGYEGLVGKTALMFHQQVGLEYEDMRQELYIKVVKAVRAYNPARSKQTQKAFVYSCIANLVKDLKRDAARRNGRFQVTYIEDQRYRDTHGTAYAASTSVFEARYQHTTHEQVFGGVEDDFVLPSTVTAEEERVLFFLLLDYAQTEIAVVLELEYGAVMKCVRSLREKLADWKPTTTPLPIPLPPQPITSPRPAVAA